jgi:hypothetical protein
MTSKRSTKSPRGEVGQRQNYPVRVIAQARLRYRWWVADDGHEVSTNDARLEVHSKVSMTTMVPPARWRGSTRGGSTGFR